MIKILSRCTIAATVTTAHCTENYKIFDGWYGAKHAKKKKSSNNETVATQCHSTSNCTVNTPNVYDIHMDCPNRMCVQLIHKWFWFNGKNTFERWVRDKMSYLGCCPCACTQQTETVFGIRVCGRYTIQSMDSAAIRLRVYRANAHDTFFFCVRRPSRKCWVCLCRPNAAYMCIWVCVCDARAPHSRKLIAMWQWGRWIEKIGRHGVDERRTLHILYTRESVQAVAEPTATEWDIRYGKSAGANRFSVASARWQTV